MNYPTALFGTDHEGLEGWFCWKFGKGCRGRLAILRHNEILDIPVLHLPDDYQQYKDRSYGPKSLSKHRTPEQQKATRREHLWHELHDLKRGRQNDDLNDEEYQKLQQLNQEYAENIAQIAPHLTLYHWQDFGILTLPKPFPAGVVCSGCKQKSVIPSLKGLPSVRKGCLLH